MIWLGCSYAIGYPMAVAISVTICHSCLPDFGAITARTRLTRRSALVNVPSFSRNDAPGRNTWANLAVSLRNRSWTTTSSIASRAAVTCLRFGSDCAMSSPWTNSPRKEPSMAASNMLGMRSPGSDSKVAPHRSSKTVRTASSETCR